MKMWDSVYVLSQIHGLGHYVDCGDAVVHIAMAQCANLVRRASLKNGAMGAFLCDPDIFYHAVLTCGTCNTMWHKMTVSFHTQTPNPGTISYYHTFLCNILAFRWFLTYSLCHSNFDKQNILSSNLTTQMWPFQYYCYNFTMCKRSWPSRHMAEHNICL